jgi:hypothetical protein
VFFPDEYTYAALGRSLAETGRPLIRGASPHFPALLQPILTAPAWLVGDVGVAYRLVQTIGALAMSLAAIPAFLLARRLGLSTRVSLAIAALSVLVPDLVYASFVSSEPFAYPLVLAAFLAAVAALERPTRRAQLVFVLFAGLATLARVQFAVLPVVFAVAALVMGARERRVRAALREQLLPLVLFLVPAIALAAGSGRALGVYRGVLDWSAHPLALLRWIGLDAMTLAYASGWIIVPGALIGLGLAMSRPRSRGELAFGVLAVLLAGALLIEAGLLQANIPIHKEIQERYVFYLVPLAGIAFALYAKRGWPARLPHFALAAALLLISVRVPLSGFAVASSVTGSPILYGVYWLSERLGETGQASFAVAATAGLLLAVAVFASRRPRAGGSLVLGLALLTAGVASAGAVAFDVTYARNARNAFLPSDPSWVDSAGLRNVALVQSWGGIRTASLQELFWNRSIDRVLLLPGAGPIDRNGEQHVHLADDGTMLVDGQPVTTPVLIDAYGSTVRLSDARLLQTGPTASLWVPNARARLSLYAVGHYHDGWLAAAGSVFLWPETPGGALHGWLSIDVTVPAEAQKPAVLRLRSREGATSSLRLEPGERGTARLAICSEGSSAAIYRSSLRGMIGLRFVSVRAAAPRFVPDPAACTERPHRVVAEPLPTAV